MDSLYLNSLRVHNFSLFGFGTFKFEGRFYIIRFKLRHCEERDSTLAVTGLRGFYLKVQSSDSRWICF